ncbi:hypothetical protein F4777DRAFT_542753 [Nemania sp. FL0916]|nr:hypothetical protein F4777DRAFT_542753 [Nemania sp. FL0916]
MYCRYFHASAYPLTCYPCTCASPIIIVPVVSPAVGTSLPSVVSLLANFARVGTSTSCILCLAVYIRKHDLAQISDTHHVCTSHPFSFYQPGAMILIPSCRPANT